MGEEKKKKKGLGGLSPEKKKQLKTLIMQKAADDMKKEALKQKHERDAFIAQSVPAAEFEGKDPGALRKMCKQFAAGIAAAENDKYDWEMKIMAQEVEINALNMKCSDTKGKFIKPVLKKVSRTDAKFEKAAKKKKGGLNVALKATPSKQEVADEEPAAEEEEEEE